MSSPDVLGRLADDGARRDAVHIAIVPITSKETLHPGQRIGLNVDGEATSDCERFIGIVDPFFVETLIRPGQKFWLCLDPGSITSLRHIWTHNAFADEEPPEEDFFTAFARKCCCTRDFLLDAATEYATENEYTHMGSNESYSNITINEWEEFWEQYATVIKGDSPKYKGGFFSCTC